MFAEKQIPKLMDGNTLDEYLARGWYRTGLSVFTCHFLFMEGSLFSTIWLRLPLPNYSFKKSLKKILQQNRSTFKTVIGPGVIDEEKEALFKKYKSSFKGRLGENLLDNLQDGQPDNIFNTYEISVYHQGKLVAFSFFDLGEKSLASITGVYDPSYSKYSLGLYTMMEEIQFGLDNGYDYFYPGYFVPGNSRFDYKLRMGNHDQVEFYDIKQQAWLNFTSFGDGTVPLKIITDKLAELGKMLTEFDISVQLVYSPTYDFARTNYGENLLESPLFLTLFADLFPRPQFLVYYDLRKEEYFFTHLANVEEIRQLLANNNTLKSKEAFLFLDFIQRKTLFVKTIDTFEITRIALGISKLIYPRIN